MSRRFVQFPHPREEAGLDRQAWLRGNTKHRRSFVVAEAMYRRSVDGQDERGLVTAWVEWEAASECRARPTGGERGSPEYVHRPISPEIKPATERIPQNTDPLVFGGRFLTTFCRQSGISLRGLLELNRGSVIVFGSRPNYQWVCDTVLVVEEAIHHDRDNYPERLTGKLSELAMTMTLRPMYAWPQATGPHNAMFGATPDAPVDGMFSFVPCLPIEDSALSGFTRPSLNAHPAINERSFRGPSCGRDFGPAELSALWRGVADIVLGAGLALATRLDVPPEDVFDGIAIR